MKRNQILRLAGLILLHELIMFLILFNYTFLTVGWHERLAKNIALFLIITVPFVLFAAFKIKSDKFDFFVKILNWLILLIALLFSIIKPSVISLESFDLFSSQKIVILNPGISFAYIVYISTIFIILPRIINFNLKKTISVFAPVIIWVLIRLLFVIVKTPMFQG